MDIQTLTSFFMWCTIINAIVYTVWVMFFALIPDLVYRMQNKLFPLPRETYDVVVYSFLGMFKLLFVIFNVVPWLALLIAT